MTGRIDKKIVHPIVVDGTLLATLNDVCISARKSACHDYANLYSVKAEQLKKYMEDGSVPKKLVNRDLYVSALRDSRIVYSASWKNDLAAKYYVFDDFLRALEQESDEIESLQLNVGRLTAENLRISLGDLFSRRGQIEASGDVDRIRIITDKLTKILKNAEPDYHILYHQRFKETIAFSGLIICLIGAFLAGSFIGFERGFAIYAVGMAAYVVTCFIIAKVLSSYYLRAFPSLVFEYGVGARHGARRKLLFAICGFGFSALIGFFVSS